MLIAANLVATVLRFLLYRHWVFGQAAGVFGKHRGSGTPERPPAAAGPGRDPAISTAEMATQGELTS